ncbi:MAG: hypothetical protein VW057_09800 [Rhodospirillaceae bacterium]
MAENKQAAAPLPTCVLIVEAEIDDDVADAWNAWYDQVHLPEALACPGVLSGRRYRADGVAAVTDHGARSRHTSQAYVTIYELTGPEAIETPAFQAMRGWYEFTDKITATTRVFNAC